MPHVRILCAADLHLGRASALLLPAPGVDLTAVGAWRRLVDAALAGAADAVVLAGDIFDGPGAYYETRHAFEHGLARLRAAGIPVVAVAGNHDWEALPRFARQFQLQVLGSGGVWESRPVRTAGGTEVTFVGWSFPGETVRESAFPRFQPPAGSPVVGIVHGDLAPQSSYHPLALDDLRGGADAWVLGHVHRPGPVGSRAVYPGSPQALDFGPGERGAHGFYWLTLEPGDARFSHLVPLSTVRFEEESLEISVIPGEDPLVAFERAVEERTDILRREQAGLECVQLRLHAGLRGAAVLPSWPQEAQALPTGADAWWLTGIRLRAERDPWQDARGSDAAAEVARLLLGARAGLEVNALHTVPEEWVGAAAQLIAGAADDAIRLFRATVAKASDVGDAMRSEPTSEEAWEYARREVVAELESLLLEVEARRAQVAG